MRRSYASDMHVAIGSAVYGTPQIRSNCALPSVTTRACIARATCSSTRGYETMTRRST